MQLIIAVYPEEPAARARYNHLEAVQQAAILPLEDLALLHRLADGSVAILAPQHDRTAAGARRGLLAGAVVGVLFPPSVIVTTLAGGALGGLVARLSGRAAAQAPALESLAADLAPGRYAVLALCRDEPAERVMEHLNGALEVKRQTVDGDLLRQLEQA